jgi:diketogulonate reductase-like aldo/keto reductase
MVGYSPFGSGDFPSAGSPGGRVLDRIARAHGATVYQVALTFLVRQPLAFTIPKSADAKHAVDNARAGDLQLTDEELRAIDAAFPAGGPRELPVL